MEKINNTDNYRNGATQFLVDWGLNDILEEFFQTTRFDDLITSSYNSLMQRIKFAQNISETDQETSAMHWDAIQYDLPKFKEEVKNIVRFQIFTKIHELVKEDQAVKKLIAKSLQKDCYKSLVRETSYACDELILVLSVIYWNNVLVDSLLQLIVRSHN